ncbi:hypothetical protein D3C73_454480 [compost metagenome]
MLSSLKAIDTYRQEGEVGTDASLRWLHYLVSAEERFVNLERIRSMAELRNTNPVLDYVEKSLHVLNRLSLSYWVKEMIEEVLIWSEVAKGGTIRQRMQWKEQGFQLFAHNIGSGDIYLQDRYQVEQEKDSVAYVLIVTHGLVGQYVRGEVPFAANAALTFLVQNGSLTADELVSLLIPLNQCVISAVSTELWDSIHGEVEYLIRCIATDNAPSELSIKDRLRRLRASSIRKGEDFEQQFAVMMEQPSVVEALERLHDQTLWFVESALQEFSYEQFVKMLLLALHDSRLSQIRHISFERLMHTMYYDYKGVKKINVYKKRIIEKYLSECTFEDIKANRVQANAHISHKIEWEETIPDILFFTFKFSPAAEKLIEFCIEAEKSPLYDKAVLMLFDLFELRRDAYDRFHNEEEYLLTMNQTADYKKVILDYIVGTRVVDIGPGGGVMLDLIEQHLPDKQPIGIDISLNVIEALERKKLLEGHRWEVLQGDALNLKDYVETGSINTVIFSSILHELYSYIPYNGSKFNHATVAAALTSAFDVLSPGGRIIIRDGIMTEPEEQKRVLRFLKEDGMLSLERYAKDFAGRKIEYEVLAADEVLMPVNDVMEFLYTYTWGEEAYVHEIQEQFGYFTPSRFIAFIQQTLGAQASVIMSRHFLQEGYTDALADKVICMNEQREQVPLPDSTCLIVIEKS